MTIGEKIKEIRLLKGMKQSELAEKAGISRVAIGNYERGDRQPNIETLTKIANALEVGLSKLLMPTSNSEIDPQTYKEIMQFNHDSFINAPVCEKTQAIKASQLQEVIKDIPLEDQTDIWRKFNAVNTDIDLKKMAVKGLFSICQYLDIDISSYSNKNILGLLESATFKAILKGMLQDLDK